MRKEEGGVLAPECSPAPEGVPPKPSSLLRVEVGVLLLMLDWQHGALLCNLFHDSRTLGSSEALERGVEQTHGGLGGVRACGARPQGNDPKSWKRPWAAPSF